MQAALLAKAGGMGGCAQLGATHTQPSQFFVGLRYISTTCEREHGDSVAVTVLVDDEGGLSLLESDAYFRWLLAVRPPLPHGREVLAYVREALTLMGRASPSDSLVPDMLRLPADVRAAARGAESLRTTIDSTTPGALRVSLILLQGASVRYFEGTLRANGMFQVMRERAWSPVRDR